MESNTEKSVNGYMLLFRGKEWDEGLGPEELKRTLDRFLSWTDGLAKSGKVKGGQPLDRTGVVLGRGGKSIADGPFAETKETVGGYLILDVDSLAEAIAIAKTSPGLDFDITIEVRPVLNECPAYKRIRERIGASQGNRLNAYLEQAA
ncbi:MAG TPA: YciI family protein [Verrucomicrobiae bacterium]|jgi:hypothetical protein|nr:YciI family protein [Verrucomicrobiae bacterium]